MDLNRLSLLMTSLMMSTLAPWLGFVAIAGIIALIATRSCRCGGHHGCKGMPRQP
jgi:hypothetical protein